MKRDTASTRHPHALVLSRVTMEAGDGFQTVETIVMITGSRSDLFQDGVVVKRTSPTKE